ncbi:uncharacterized protein [Primulina eburnea]|uniref:uncharacterized protein n=1 Tax=Primulina eburnea TaxID=1245227 RepID=UPI003C6C6CE3
MFVIVGGLNFSAPTFIVSADLAKVWVWPGPELEPTRCTGRLTGSTGLCNMLGMKTSKSLPFWKRHMQFARLLAVIMIVIGVTLEYSRPKMMVQLQICGGT